MEIGRLTIGAPEAGGWLALIGIAVAAIAVLAVRARRSRRRRLRDALITAALFAKVVDEPHRADELVSGAVGSSMEPAGHPLKTIIVTGSDSAHYDLVVDLLVSLTDPGRDGLSVGFVHVGDDAVPADVAAGVDHVAHVADDSFRDEKLHGFRLAYLMIKPRLPELFPGYDIYVWLDGDTWVQNRLGLDQIIACAQMADLCAHPELDPNYFHERTPSDRLIGLYGALYGQKDAAQHIRLPMFNAGVFAATAASPLWALWREALLEVGRPMAETPGLYFSDQVPLHRLLATGRVTVHPLRSLNNWLVHAAAPGVDLARKRLVTTSYPHEEINILHLTWITKDRTYRLGDSGREVSFRYRNIKALFAE